MKQICKRERMFQESIEGLLGSIKVYIFRDCEFKFELEFEFGFIKIFYFV